MTLSRRLLLGGAAAIPAAAALPAAATESPGNSGNSRGNFGGKSFRQPRDVSEELLDQWADAPGAHPLVPDISHAGYRGGERPRRPRTVARVTDFGARPGSTEDAGPAAGTAGCRL